MPFNIILKIFLSKYLHGQKNSINFAPVNDTAGWSSGSSLGS